MPRKEEQPVIKEIKPDVIKVTETPKVVSKEEALLKDLYVTRDEWGVWGSKLVNCPRCKGLVTVNVILVSDVLRYGCSLCNFNGEYKE